MGSALVVHDVGSLLERRSYSHQALEGLSEVQPEALRGPQRLVEGFIGGSSACLSWKC